VQEIIMRSTDKSQVHDVPRWLLWLVALVCFGPLTVQWLLGVLIFPFWVEMLAFQIAEPERFLNDASVSIWDFAWPMGFVISGGVGLVGLLRVLTLSRRRRPTSHRVFTLGLVAVGLVPLLIFDAWIVVGTLGDLSARVPVVALAIYLVFPFAGAAWLLSKSWQFLSAGPRDDHREIPMRAPVRPNWRS
jgi:hypothetical protein